VDVYWDDFVGQAALQGDRVGLLDPGFYARTVANEWRRLAWLSALIRA
jgi:hypothetical protein